MSTTVFVRVIYLNKIIRSSTAGYKYKEPTYGFTKAFKRCKNPTLVYFVQVTDLPNFGAAASRTVNRTLVKEQELYINIYKGTM